MKTNYKTDNKLVLTSSEGKVIAIIDVPSGADIKNKLEKAIIEELLAEKVEFLVDQEMEEYDYESQVHFAYKDEEGEEFEDTYTLTLTAEY
jgi:hypothetical protein